MPSSLRTGGELLVGLTGGIGSGKSLAAKLFRQRGRTVISADDVARELTESDPTVRRDIRAAFGPGVFSTGGLLNRGALASLVFTDRSRLQLLNSIVHPAVFRRINRLIRLMPLRRRRPYLLIEAALIFETGMERHLDYTVVVHSSLDLRIHRVMKRDRCSATDVRRRIRSQLPASRKARMASFLLENNGTPGELARRVAILDTVLTAIARGATG